MAEETPAPPPAAEAPAAPEPASPAPEGRAKRERKTVERLTIVEEKEGIVFKEVPPSLPTIDAAAGPDPRRCHRVLACSLRSGRSLRPTLRKGRSPRIPF